MKENKGFYHGRISIFFINFAAELET